VEHVNERTAQMQVRPAGKEPVAPDRITPALSPYTLRLAQCIDIVEHVNRAMSQIMQRLDVGS